MITYFEQINMMKRNNSKDANSNFFPVPQNDGISVDESHIDGNQRKRLKGKETKPKYFYGIRKKSLFSASARQGIKSAGFSEKDRLNIRGVKLRRLISYIAGVERERRIKDLISKPHLKMEIASLDKNEPKYIGSKEDEDIIGKYFQHREFCTDGASCNLEACSEITELLTCWEKCLAAKNIDCSLCGSTLQGQLFLEEEMELHRRSEREPRKKHCELIANYNGFKVITLESDLHKKSLFSGSGHHDLQSEDFSDQEKKDIKLIKLLRILHAEECSKEDCACPDCELLKVVLSHIHRNESHPESHSNGVLCTFENCLEVMELLSHWNHCLTEKDFKCLLCGDFLSRYCNLQEEILEFRKEIGRKLSDVNIRSESFNNKPAICENPLKIQDFFSKW